MERFTQADGRRLAIDMLLEIRDDVGVNESVLDDDARDGRPQSDVLARYMRTVKHAGGAAEAGFVAVLTDFIASAFEATPDPAEYERREARLN
jgi:hypothetical protein